MTFVPTPIRALIGLAATAVDEIKKLDETIPEAATSVPVAAVSFLMQTSMKVQQQIAEYAARGDEVISHLRGTSDEAPAWATFDDEPETPPAGAGRRAAFDEVDLDEEDFDEEDDAPPPPPVVTEPAAPPQTSDEPTLGAAKKTAPKKAVKKAPAKKAAKKVPPAPFE